MKKTRWLRILICLILLVAANRGFVKFWKVYTAKVANRVLNRVAAEAHATAGSELELLEKGMVDGSFNGKGEEAFGPFTVPVAVFPSALLREDLTAEVQGTDASYASAYEFLNDQNGLLGPLWGQKELTKSVLPEEVLEQLSDELSKGSQMKVTKYYRDGEEVVPVEISVVKNGKESVYWSAGFTGTEPGFTASSGVFLDRYAKPSRFRTYFGRQAWNYLTEGTGGVYRLNLVWGMNSNILDRVWYLVLPNQVGVCTNYYVVSSPLRGELWFLLISAGLAVILIFATEKVLGKLEKRMYAKFYQPGHETMVINALAHDLKTSLMVIEGSAENLAAGVPQEKERKFWEQMTSETERVHHILTKMEQFRDTAELSDTPLHSMEMNTLIERVTKRYEAAAHERGLSFSVEDKGLFVFEGEEDLADMVIDNFIHNAVKYAKEGTEIAILIEENRVCFRNEWEPVEAYRKNPERFFLAYDVGNRVRGSEQGSGVGLSIAANVLRYFGLQYKAVVKKEEISFELYN